MVYKIIIEIFTKSRTNIHVKIIKEFSTNISSEVRHKYKTKLQLHVEINSFFSHAKVEKGSQSCGRRKKGREGKKALFRFFLVLL